MVDHNPSSLPGTWKSPSSPGESADGSSLQPEPDLDQAVQRVSEALTDLRGVIKELACQEEPENTAVLQPQAQEQHYRELFTGAPGGYLVTDPAGTIQECNPAAADLLQTPQELLLGKRLISFVSQKDYETFYSLMDQALQGSDTQGIMVHLQPPGRPPSPVFLAMAGGRNPAGELAGFNWLIHPFPQRWQDEEAQKKKATQLESCFTALVKAFSTASEMHAPYAWGHQRRVAQLSGALAQEIGFTPDRVEGVKIMGFLHDIGNGAIPVDIFNKTGPLSTAECNIVKTHPLLGYNLLKDLESPWPVATAILQHHERLNGSGYPAGLSGDKIIMEARILAVADVVEAMVSPRPYGTAAGIEEALDEVSKEMGTLYDPEVVNACLKLFVEKGFKFA